MKTRFDLKSDNVVLSAMNHEDGHVLVFMQGIDTSFGVPLLTSPISIVCTIDQLKEVVKGVEDDDRRTKKSRKEVLEEEHCESDPYGKSKYRPRHSAKARQNC